MPMLIVPNSHGSLHEFNPCHAKQDGKFCSTPGGAPTAKPQGRRARPDLTGKLAARSAEVRKDPEVAKLADQIRKTAPTRQERRFADLIAHAEIENARLLKNGDSKSQNTTKDGLYTPERLAMHRKVLEEIGANIPINQKQPVAIMMGGMTAAGKTTSVGKTLKLHDKVVINADEMKEHLPGYNGKNASFLHEESSDLADSAFRQAMKLKQHIVLDSTMKSLGGVDYNSAKGDGGLARKIEELRANGYRVEIRFVDVDVETSIKRSLSRFVEKELADGKGRYVPRDVIRSNKDRDFGTKPKRTFHYAKDVVDAYLVMDNRTGKPKVLSRKGRLTEARRPAV